MTNNNTTYAYGELATGETWDDIQVRLEDKLRYERTARAQKWQNGAEAPFTFGAFISFAAAKRAGVLPADLGWPAFVASAIDAGIRQPEPTEDPEPDEDPTRPVASID